MFLPKQEKGFFAIPRHWISYSVVHLILQCICSLLGVISTSKCVIHMFALVIVMHIVFIVFRVDCNEIKLMCTLHRSSFPCENFGVPCMVLAHRGRPRIGYCFSVIDISWIGCGDRHGNRTKISSHTPKKSPWSVKKNPLQNIKMFRDGWYLLGCQFQKSTVVTGHHCAWNFDATSVIPVLERTFQRTIVLCAWEIYNCIIGLIPVFMIWIPSNLMVLSYKDSNWIHLSRTCFRN